MGLKKVRTKNWAWKFWITQQESSFALLKKNFQMYLRYLLISWQKMGLFTASKCSESSPNIKTELRTSPNISFLTKTELRTSRTSQKTEQFANIELFVPPLVYSLLELGMPSYRFHSMGSLSINFTNVKSTYCQYCSFYNK